MCTVIEGSNLFVVNSPLILGGMTVDLHRIGKALGWSYIPSMKSMVGCIENFTFNDQVSIYSFTIFTTFIEKCIILLFTIYVYYKVYRKWVNQHFTTLSGP